MKKESIFDYITEEEYENKIKGLKDSETRNIYKSGNIEIDVKKVGRHIYKFINVYGNEKFVDCIVRMYEASLKR